MQRTVNPSGKPYAGSNPAPSTSFSHSEKQRHFSQVLTSRGSTSLAMCESWIFSRSRRFASQTPPRGRPDRPTRDLVEQLGFTPVDFGRGGPAMRAVEALGDAVRLVMIDGARGGRAHLAAITLPDPDLETIGGRQSSSYRWTNVSALSPRTVRAAETPSGHDRPSDEAKQSRLLNLCRRLTDRMSASLRAQTIDRRLAIGALVPFQPIFENSPSDRPSFKRRSGSDRSVIEPHCGYCDCEQRRLYQHAGSFHRLDQARRSGVQRSAKSPHSESRSSML